MSSSSYVFSNIKDAQIANREINARILIVSLVKHTFYLHNYEYIFIHAYYVIEPRIVLLMKLDFVLMEVESMSVSKMFTI